MENNITNLFKAINFMNKKTLIPTFDEYIFIEKGSFILQDAFKTYVYSLEALNSIGNYAFTKESFLSLKTKNAKYFLEEIKDNMMYIKITTKNSEEIKSVPLVQTCINIKDIISKEFKCSNDITTDGTAFKLMLSGCSDSMGFKCEDDKVFISVADDKSYIDFNEMFSEICTLELIQSDNSLAEIDASNLVDAIKLFGLVKKNPSINLSFNENCFVFNKENLSIYILSNKL